MQLISILNSPNLPYVNAGIIVHFHKPQNVFIAISLLCHFFGISLLR